MSINQVLNCVELLLKLNEVNFLTSSIFLISRFCIGIRNRR
jgi:hypothetical protein